MDREEREASRRRVDFARERDGLHNFSVLPSAEPHFSHDKLAERLQRERIAPGCYRTEPARYDE
jgi:hypothetical protein